MPSLSPRDLTVPPGDRIVDLAAQVDAESLARARAEQRCQVVVDDVERAGAILDDVIEHLRHWITDGGQVTVDLLVDPAGELAAARAHLERASLQG